jgi:hypothetical protein
MDQEQQIDRVVCSALRNKAGAIVTGVRHFDTLMRDQIRAQAVDSKRANAWAVAEQGFVNQRGEFLTRLEAWHVAANACQIIRRVGGDDRDGGMLYSENIY